MVSVSISVDFAAVTRQLTDVQRRQMPFAIKNTLDGIAFAARREMIDVAAPRDLEIRNKRFFGVAIRVDKAAKDKFVARIYDALGREFLKTQVEGGYNKPAGGRRAFTVPVDELKAKRTGAGVPKRLRPKEVKDSFRIEQGGRTYIARRVGRRGEIELLYLLAKKARIPRRWKAYDALDQIAQSRASVIFAEQFARALATARR